MTTPLSIAALLIAALVVASVIAYPHLPERIPQHFGADGEPDRWVATSMLSWMLLPIVATAVTAFVAGIASLASRDIRYINLPNKERLAALPAERQAELLAIVRRSLHWIVAIVALLFCGIQAEVYLTARGIDSGPLPWLSLACIAAILATALAMTMRVVRMTETR